MDSNSNNLGGYAASFNIGSSSPNSLYYQPNFDVNTSTTTASYRINRN